MTLLINPFVFAGSKPGNVLLSPSSVTYSGTSASITGNGQVVFTSVLSVSVNGIFSADFDTYMISARLSGAGQTNIYARLRASGVDDTGTNYLFQSLNSYNSTYDGARSSASSAEIFQTYGSLRSGNTAFVYRPAIADTTSWRSVSAGDFQSGGNVRDIAATHALDTAYDGMTFFDVNVTNPITGALQVYGVRS